MPHLSSEPSGAYSIRPAEVEESAAMLAFFQRVRSESPYLLLQPDEGIQDVDGQRRQISSIASGRRQALLVAFFRHQPVGFVGVTRGSFVRNEHVATLVLAVEVLHQRRGLGSLLVQKAAGWARDKGVKRLELTVAAENTGAVKLYQAHGFVQEGVKRSSFRVRDSFVDELLMARLFCV